MILGWLEKATLAQWRKKNWGNHCTSVFIGCPASYVSKRPNHQSRQCKQYDKSECVGSMYGKKSVIQKLLDTFIRQAAPGTYRTLKKSHSKRFVCSFLPIDTVRCELKQTTKMLQSHFFSISFRQNDDATLLHCLLKIRSPLLHLSPSVLLFLVKCHSKNECSLCLSGYSCQRTKGLYIQWSAQQLSKCHKV